MDKNERAKLELQKGIEIAVNRAIENAPFDKIDVGIIKGISENGYTVSVNGISYSNVKTIGGSCIINETVKVVTPQNQSNNMFILKGGESGSSTTDVKSVNGKSGDVILDASDVGALPSSTYIPTKTSDLTNDSNFVNVSTVDSKISTHNNSANAHSSLFGLKLNATEANPFIKSVAYDSDNGIITFVSYNNITTTIDLPIENIVSSGYYDETTQDIALVLSSGEELRIPASGLVDDYSGGTTNTIQILVSNDNIITANLIRGSITKTLLSQELQTSLDSLISDKHTHSNKTILDNTTASYTTEEKNKLSGVENGAEVNIPINNQTPTWTISSALTNLVSGETISLAFGKIAKAIAILISHIANVSNPHQVTKTQVGLSNVDNTSDVDKPISTTTQNALNGKAPISHASESTTYGISSASNYGHPKASSATPLVAGTASVGTDNGQYARGNHVHPLQTSVSGSSGSCTGNSATATKATQDASGNTITTSYGSTLSLSGSTVTLKSKSGATLSSVTVPTGSVTWTDV